MRISSRIAALERRAIESRSCRCPPGNGIEVVIAEKGQEPPKARPPCPICGHYKTLVIISECAPPTPLPDVGPAANTPAV